MRTICRALGLVTVSVLTVAAGAQAQPKGWRDCTVIESLPTVITASGSYCLARDFATALPGGAAIWIEADDVTVDLRGHAIDNSGADPGSLALGVASWERSRVVVRNGALRGFWEGVSLSGPSGTQLSENHLVEGMRISRSGRIGIGIGGRDAIVRGNSVYDTGSGDQKTLVTGIWVAGWRHRVLDNDVVRTAGSVHSDVAILFLDGGSGMAVGNRISAADQAIVFPLSGSGFYRDNLANEIPCCDAFVGGTDLGGNSWQ
jgi:hypothetical protein